MDDQIAHLKIKLNRAIIILSKIRHKTKPTMLKVMYHSFFESNLLLAHNYVCQPTWQIKIQTKFYKIVQSGKCSLKSLMKQSVEISKNLES